MSNTEMELGIVHRSLSAQRMKTYEEFSQGKPCSALQLYSWNAQISAALLVPLHFCEVTLRNAASEALSNKYGERWPWSTAFERSLPNKGKYSQKQDLMNARQKASTTGQTIPELKFVFWQKLFTSRFDERIWNSYLRDTLPNFPIQSLTAHIRKQIYQDLDVIRNLRNRIAHHEPIFKRDLDNDFAIIQRLISYRCPQTADWMQQHQQVSQLLIEKPF